MSSFEQRQIRAVELFGAGEIIYLKSGSPPMTVSRWTAIPSHLVAVEWFDGATIKRDLFDPECVTLKKPE